MVAPFFGCAFGGFLHDVFLYQGDTPINTPWMGLRRITSTPQSSVFRTSRTFSSV